MSNFFSALSFLTILSASKGNLPWKDGRQVMHFPLVGLLIGGMLCGADLLFSLYFCGEVRAILDVLFLAVISGGLHLDGLADTADGIFSHRSREEMLRIMKDGRIGAMGTLALIFCLLLKCAGAYALEEETRWVWLLAAPALARSAQVVGLVFMDYARREGGIANHFFQKGKYRFLAWIPLSILPPFFLGVGTGLGALLSFILLTAAVLLFFQNKIEGMTGDTLGALSEVMETAVLVVVCRPY